MLEGLSLCKVCNREVLDNGQCLYCTTSEALDLRALVPDDLLTAPEAGDIVYLAELGGPRRRFALDQPRVRIGRDPKCQIQISDDVYVSKFHAFITFEDGQYWIEDLGSKNGTLLNQAHILDREVLNHGDVLTVGHTEFRVE